jgi:tetrahydromethanopterin S-methyltransferase subunit H
MFEFKAEQRVCTIGGVKVGGIPGENPTVMIGSLFYKGHRVVKDEAKGEIDTKETRRQIALVEEFSGKTGLPSMLDVVGTTPQAMKRYLDFVSGVTSMPLLLDGLTEETVLEGLDYVEEVGLKDRIVLNSLTPDTRQSIYEKVLEIGLKSAVLLTYSAKAIVSSEERARLAGDLIARAEAAGVENILVDTVVMDLATLGLAIRAIYEVKDRFGYPAGCGAHNAIQMWKTLKTKFNPESAISTTAVANTLPIALGGDFVLYGPAKDAHYIYPAAGLLNLCYGQLLMEKGVRLTRDHPRFLLAKV